MIKSTILSMILAIAPQCDAPAPVEDLAPAVRIDANAKPPCTTRLVIIGWDDPTDCDLDGSQVLMLSDEFTDLPEGVNAMTDCHNRGGIFSYDYTDPITYFCTDIDY